MWLGNKLHGGINLDYTLSTVRIVPVLLERLNPSLATRVAKDPHESK